MAITNGKTTFTPSEAAGDGKDNGTGGNTGLDMLGKSVGLGNVLEELGMSDTPISDVGSLSPNVGAPTSSAPESSVGDQALVRNAEIAMRTQQQEQQRSSQGR